MAGHIALHLLQRKGHINLIVTQNVDRFVYLTFLSVDYSISSFNRLHQKSGSRHVIDLHGRNDQVKCMSCDHQLPREVMQDTLRRNNQNFLNFVNSLEFSLEDTRADGDTELGAIDYEQLDLPNCPVCDGILKPNVVFFGDNVPVNIVNEIYEKVRRSHEQFTDGNY